MGRWIAAPAAAEQPAAPAPAAQPAAAPAPPAAQPERPERPDELRDDELADMSNKQLKDWLENHKPACPLLEDRWNDIHKKELGNKERHIFYKLDHMLVNINEDYVLNIAGDVGDEILLWWANIPNKSFIYDDIDVRYKRQTAKNLHEMLRTMTYGELNKAFFSNEFWPKQNPIYPMVEAWQHVLKEDLSPNQIHDLAI
jgi:hypothetical protein